MVNRKLLQSFPFKCGGEKICPTSASNFIATKSFGPFVLEKGFVPTAFPNRNVHNVRVTQDGRILHLHQLTEAPDSELRPQRPHDSNSRRGSVDGTVSHGAAGTET